MRKLLLAIAFAASSTAVGSAGAEVYPSRPIKLIVPFSAGGVTDITARIVGERMRASFGQPVIAENAAGAGGTIGVARVVRAAPDGYTIGIGQWTSHVGSGDYSQPTTARNLRSQESPALRIAGMVNRRNIALASAGDSFDLSSIHHVSMDIKAPTTN